MDKLDKPLSKFIEQQQLPTSYVETTKAWFYQLASDIALHQKSATKCIIVGINGAQGSGKSTLAALLVFLMEHCYGLKSVSLSLDDFYYTRKQRTSLAEQIHPLLMTRGVPGTHDVALAKQTLHELMTGQSPVHIPRFNKAIDDRYPPEQFEAVSEAIDVIVFEGWCMGSTAQTPDKLDVAVNDLEANEDQHGNWRRYVNQQLQDVYPDLFGLIDTWVMLKAPSFECVYQWRLEQEQKLKRSLTSNDAQQQVMNEEAIHHFIKFYQRITQHTLTSLPSRVDYLYEMDAQRNIINLSIRHARNTDMKKPVQWLIFTDMDGSLLDHHNYRYDEAIPVIHALEMQNIPLIPISSKTAAELELFKDSIANQHPFVAENGAAVFIPIGYFPQQPEQTIIKGKYWIKEFVQPREHWQSLIEALRPQFGDQFKTFSEVGIDGIMALTGLNVHAAARAAQRHYGEPVSWHGNGQLQQQFIAAIEARGAQVLKGGRFIHVSGDCDKGKALQWLSNIYQQHQSDKRIQSLAIGDSQNDTAMLETADYALLIRSPVHPLPEINKFDHVYVSKDTGPKGWAQGVSDIVDAALHPDSSDIPRGNHG